MKNGFYLSSTSSELLSSWLDVYHLLSQSADMINELEEIAASVPTIKAEKITSSLSRENTPVSELTFSIKKLKENLQAINEINARITTIHKQIEIEVQAIKSFQRRLFLIGAILIVVLIFIFMIRESSPNTGGKINIAPLMNGAGENVNSMTTSSVEIRQYSQATQTASNIDITVINNGETSDVGEQDAAASTNVLSEIVFGSQAEANDAWKRQNLEVEDVSTEQYTDEDRSIPGKILTYTITLDRSQPLLLTNRWCARNRQILEDNLQSIDFYSMASDETIFDELAGNDIYEVGNGSWICFARYILIKSFPQGTTFFTTRKIIKNELYDGSTYYPSGDLIREFEVNIP